MQRTVLKRLLISEKSEGGGGRKIRESVGGAQLKFLDPFILLIEAILKAPTGFPDHPHRGFETSTYILKGKLTHKDFRGHQGTIGPGDLQWITTGRGVVHSEMPAEDNNEEVHLLQLWINLKKDLKMCKPAYQELLAEEVPKLCTDGATIAVLSGESLGVQSKVYTRTPTLFLHVVLKPGATLNQAIPKGWTGLVYTLSGDVEISGRIVAPHHTAVLSDGDFVLLTNTSNEESRFAVVAGEPINEPVAQCGLIVMNTQEEIENAKSDFENATNGFENAHTWNTS